jgi:hypothetical protein
MSCPGNGIQCDTVQVLEPDSSVPVADAGGTADPSITERGEYVLAEGETLVEIAFLHLKASPQFRFEYLYVDTLDVPGIEVHPGVHVCVPILQTTEGFGLRIAGAPIHAGYVIRWRVVVVDFTIVELDAPEQIVMPIPMLADLMSVPLQNPRSTPDYGFSELRVENLTDPAASQAIINVQVVGRSLGLFVLGINPRPPTANYVLVARIP